MFLELNRLIGVYDTHPALRQVLKEGYKRRHYPCPQGAHVNVTENMK